MTPQQIALVEACMTQVRPRMDSVVQEFYARLFETDPSLRPLFPDDMTDQRHKFVAGLQLILSSLNETPELMDHCRALGAAHLGYGAEPRHYRLVGDALLAALADGLGEGWTVELQAAWAAAYDLTAEVMMTGAFEASLSA